MVRLALVAANIGSVVDISSTNHRNMHVFSLESAISKLNQKFRKSKQKWRKEGNP
jgi:hypothetical protein